VRRECSGDASQPLRRLFLLPPKRLKGCLLVTLSVCMPSSDKFSVAG